MKGAPNLETPVRIIVSDRHSLHWFAYVDSGWNANCRPSFSVSRADLPSRLSALPQVLVSRPRLGLVLLVLLLFFPYFCCSLIKSTWLRATVDSYCGCFLHVSNSVK